MLVIITLVRASQACSKTLKAILFIALCIPGCLGALTFLVSWPSHTTDVKEGPFECGFEPFYPARMPSPGLSKRHWDHPTQVKITGSLKNVPTAVKFYALNQAAMCVVAGTASAGRLSNQDIEITWILRMKRVWTHL